MDFQQGKQPAGDPNSMLTIVNNIWVERLVRLIVGITFIYASVHKIIAPDEFAKVIYGYELFPHLTINLIAIILPFVELFSGLCIVFSIRLKASTIIAVLMLALFSLAISINLIRGHEFDCGCFSFGSGHSHLDTIFLLVRDVVLIVFCCFLLRFGGGTTISAGIKD